MICIPSESGLSFQWSILREFLQLFAHREVGCSWPQMMQLFFVLATSTYTFSSFTPHLGSAPDIHSDVRYQSAEADPLKFKWIAALPEAGLTPQKGYRSTSYAAGMANRCVGVKRLSISNFVHGHLTPRTFALDRWRAVLLDYGV